MTKKEQKMSQDLLNKILANKAVLLVKTLNFHWNIVGAEFHDFHALFDDQYRLLFENLDVVAERIRAVGGVALGSMAEMIKHADLKEDTGKTPKPSQMVLKLLQDYEFLIETIREAIVTLDHDTSDFGSINMLEELLTKYEKVAWMLRSLLGRQ